MTTPQAAPSPPEQFVLVLAAIFLPPLATFLAQRTIFTKEFLVTVVLTLFGHIPGVYLPSTFYFALISLVVVLRDTLGLEMMRIK